MNGRRWIPCALTVVLAAALVAADKQPPPPGGQPRDFRLPARTALKLDNGLAATLVRYGALPKVTVSVVVRSGNIDEPADAVWLADLTGRMMQEGTTGRDSAALAADVARMGGEIEISVGLDTTTLECDVLAEFGADAVRLLADVVRNPAFPEAELARLTDDMARQLTIQLSEPGSLADRRFAEAIYGDHPYGRLFPTEEMIRSYDVARVRDFHGRNFGARRTRVYVAGLFDEAAVEAAIRDGFGGWAAGPEPLVRPPKMRSRREILLVDRAGASQSTLRLGLPVIGPENGDYTALLVTNALLGGSFGSRITSNIREDKGYTYSPYSSVAVRYRAAHWVQSADVTTDVTGAAVREILYEIGRLRNEPPAPDELRGIQNYLAGVFVLQNSSRGGIISQLAFLDLHGLDDGYLTGYVQRIHAVTAEDVQRIARAYIRDKEMTIVAVGDASKVAGQLKPFGTVAR